MYRSHWHVISISKEWPPKTKHQWSSLRAKAIQNAASPFPVPLPPIHWDEPPLDQSMDHSLFRLLTSSQRGARYQTRVTSHQSQPLQSHSAAAEHQPLQRIQRLCSRQEQLAGGLLLWSDHCNCGGGKGEEAAQLWDHWSLVSNILHQVTRVRRPADSVVWIIVVVHSALMRKNE